MTDEQLQEMRSRIAELEERDADFARKSNLFLDEILITRNQIAENAKAIALWLVQDNQPLASGSSGKGTDAITPCTPSYVILTRCLTVRQQIREAVPKKINQRCVFEAVQRWL